MRLGVIDGSTHSGSLGCSTYPTDRMTILGVGIGVVLVGMN